MNESELISRFKQGPVMLLLGQAYWQVDSGRDLLLEEIGRKLRLDQSQATSYRVLLETGDKGSEESILAWLDQKCSILSPPPYFETLTQIGWTSILSSSIDSIWYRAFRSDWREVIPIFEEKYYPSDSRSRLRLHCFCLFGSVNRTQMEDRPPLNVLDYLKRRQTAVSMARRIPELLTPLGTLVILGHSGKCDWLAFEDLAPIIDDLAPGQAHLFDSDETIFSDPLYSALATKGKITGWKSSFPSLIAGALSEGRLRFDALSEETGGRRRVNLGGKNIAVPSHIWNTVTHSAIVLERAHFEQPYEASAEKRYHDFRNFLAETSNNPIWSGYSRGFAFGREFEHTLTQAIHKRLQDSRNRETPIIVSGQTGTGKTIALQSIAYSFGIRGDIPVLFIPRRSQRPLSADVDLFCKWAEDTGATGTLIVWDGMLRPENYFDLAGTLSGRGRKILLVGSSYAFETEALMREMRNTVIEAPAELSEKEILRFTDFLNSIDPSLAAYLTPRSALFDESFLVALYRLLPPSRSSIRSGLVGEVGFAEQELEKALQNQPVGIQGRTLLGEALIRAGLLGMESIPSEDGLSIDGETYSFMQSITALVMVPGRFGLRIPIELLLRALGTNSFGDFQRVLSASSVFSWSEDAHGNILIGPRHPLEAKLIVEARLGGSRAEADVAKKLIIDLRDSPLDGDSSEVQFILDLVRSMGPDGESRDYFGPYFEEFANTFSELRTRRGVRNLRLMLTEANLLREFVSFQSSRQRPTADAARLLQQAEDVLVSILEETQHEKPLRRLTSAVLVELASVQGARLISELRSSSGAAPAAIALDKLRSYLRDALALDPENYYPYDVLSWATTALLKSSICDPELRLSAQAEILHYLAIAESMNFTPDARQRLDQRRMEVGQLIKDDSMVQSAFDSLLQSGSALGYYLKAVNLAGDFVSEEKLTERERLRCESAVDFLQDNYSAIAVDAKCLYLLFRLWWRSQTGKKLFAGERQTLAFSREKWKHLESLLILLLSCSEFHLNPTLKYLKGITEFHLGGYESSFQLFSELERDSESMRGLRRIVRSYLSSREDGGPRVYNGTVNWVDVYKNRGEVFVEELRRSVTFLPLDFGRPNIKQYDALPPFHLAFNFIGIVVDPAEKHRTLNGKS
jgi:hypothetical protein